LIVADTKNKEQMSDEKTPTKKTKTLKTQSIDLDPIEYFYLETPNIPSTYLPVNIYGIYDRVTVEDQKL
jgi:hypothetical protein